MAKPEPLDKVLEDARKLLATLTDDQRKALGLKIAKPTVDPAKIEAAIKEVKELLSKKYQGVTIGHLNRGSSKTNPIYDRPNSNETWQWNGRKDHKKPDWVKPNTKRKVTVTNS